MTFTGHIYSTVVVPSGVTVSATNGGGGPTVVTWTAGTYTTPATALAALIAALQATRAPSGDAWTGSISTTTGLVTIDCPTDTWSITWTSTEARDLLGFAANISSVTTAQTGTLHCRGLWIPDRPINMDASYLSLPDVTDNRGTRSPTGLVISHTGNTHYRHRNLRWMNVDSNRVWIASETTTHQSLQRFMLDTQWGTGHAWFTPSSKCVLVAHDGNQVGNSGVAGWYLIAPPRMEDIASRSREGWDGQFSIAIPEAISNG